MKPSFSALRRDDIKQKVLRALADAPSSAILFSAIK
jgi:hypothetical protein